MNNYDLANQILIQLVEVIVQNRVAVRKKQMKRFNDFVQGVGTHTIPTFRGDVKKLLAALLLQPVTQARQLLCSEKQNQRVLIVFVLKLSETEREIYAQTWQLDLEREKAQVQSDAFSMVSSTFQQLLYFLNRQPLFMEYQKNSRIKSEYKIDYKIFLENFDNLYQIREIQKRCQILQLNKKHIFHRVSSSLTLTVQCSSLATLEDLASQPKVEVFSHILPRHNTLPPKAKFGYSVDLIQSESSEFIHLGSLKPRRMSLYEFYDEKLDFTFLSNDDKSFSSSPKGSVKQMEIEEAGPSEEQEFQMLEVSRDQILVQEITSLLLDLSTWEKDEQEWDQS